MEQINAWKETLMHCVRFFLDTLIAAFRIVIGAFLSLVAGQVLSGLTFKNFSNLFI